MPLLSEEDLRHLRDTLPTTCLSCGETLRKNYCRQCDEFFSEGHKADCPDLNDPQWREDHRGHRTY